MTLNLLKSLVHNIKKFINEDRLKNNLVKEEILSINMQRMVYMISITILVHIVLILQFKFDFIPTTAIEAKWRMNVATIHSINAIIVFLIMLIVIYLNKREASFLSMKIIQMTFMLDVIIVGIVLVVVDQYVTTNITPFLIVCIMIGVLVLNKPIVAIGLYIMSYIVFYQALGLYQTKETILMTNRGDGLVFVSIGICISTIMWYTYRTNILQAAKIKKQQRELEKLAFYDSLTGLYNRRKWLSILNDEMRRMSRYGHESSVILLDIDHFKMINDKFGHPAGDAVLKEIAAILKNQIRKTDKIARWGGEEFIFLLTETPVEKAVIAAEKIRMLIETRGIKSQGHEFSVTASFGVAGLNSTENSFEKTYNQVDQALYLAKRKGRNRVECISHKDDV